MLVLVVGAWRPASAQASASEAARDAARARLVEGVALLKQSDFAGALAKFQAAYELVPSPNIHYDLGLAYVGLGRSADALLAFDRFLAEAPGAPADSRRKAATNQEVLRRQVATVTIATEAPGAEISVDGRVRGALPLAHPLYLDPGPHEIGARWPIGGGTVSQTVVATAGAELSLQLPPPGRAHDVDAPSAPAVSRTLSAPAPGPGNLIEKKVPAGKAESRWSTLAVSSAGVGAVFLGASLTFGLLARYEGDRLSTLSSQMGFFEPDAQSDGHTFKTLAEVSLGAGILALGTAAVIFAMNGRSLSTRVPAVGNNDREGSSY
ncbi:MAG TPA: hypothetical protein VMU50_12630 [Polyangia bacterium]|nr:hypothetical protein [Polyangia bacterium]